jgi:hypothetical protein
MISGMMSMISMTQKLIKMRCSHKHATPRDDEAFGKEKREHFKWIVLRHKRVS